MRAEYTPRPAYCKGSTNSDKQIILNSFVAEKLMALDNEKYCNEKMTAKLKKQLKGRLEQAMRIEFFKDISKNFNDIEIRNSIVSYIYLNALKKKNITKIITGDGADEIFAGYNFLVKKDHDELQKELKRMKKIMHFTSQKIANELGISVQMPFIDESIIKFVETLPVNLLVNQNYGIKFGKWILRKAFENDLPSSVIWREKTPMQDGSGTVGLIKMFDSVITDDIFKEKTKKIKSEDNVTIRTKESLHYYEFYKENFKIPECTNGNNQCSDCNAEIVSNSKFCGMCGRFPI